MPFGANSGHMKVKLINTNRLESPNVKNGNGFRSPNILLYKKSQTYSYRFVAQLYFRPWNTDETNSEIISWEPAGNYLCIEGQEIHE